MTQCCQDCGNAVSFSAGTCPNCGSSMPRSNGRAYNLFHIDEKNDKRLMAALGGGSTVGLIYGIVMSSRAIGAVFDGLVYDVLGAIIAALVAFAIKLLSARC